MTGPAVHRPFEHGGPDRTTCGVGARRHDWNQYGASTSLSLGTESAGGWTLETRLPSPSSRKATSGTSAPTSPVSLGCSSLLPTIVDFYGAACARSSSRTIWVRLPVGPVLRCNDGRDSRTTGDAQMVPTRWRCLNLPSLESTMSVEEARAFHKRVAGGPATRPRGRGMIEDGVPPGAAGDRPPAALWLDGQPAPDRSILCTAPVIGDATNDGSQSRDLCAATPRS